MLHDDYGHQGLDQTLALVKERFYWSTMNHDAAKYVTNVISVMWLRVITQVHIHNRGCLLPIIPWTCCVLIFLKVDPSRDGKENILVLTDAFHQVQSGLYYQQSEGTYHCQDFSGKMVLCVWHPSPYSQ